MTGPMGRRVRKFDGAFGPEGCGIALAGDEYYNAAFRRSRPHRVSYSFLPSYTLSRCAGLPLKGKQGLAAELAMCCLSPAKHSAEFATPLWCLTAPPFFTGKRLTWFSGRYHSPTNQVRLPPRCAGKVPRSGQGGTLFPRAVHILQRMCKSVEVGP